VKTFAKSLTIREKWRPTWFDLKKLAPNICRITWKYFFLCVFAEKLAPKFFGQVWGNLCKILRTPKNSPAPTPMIWSCLCWPQTHSGQSAHIYQCSYTASGGGPRKPTSLAKGLIWKVVFVLQRTRSTFGHLCGPSLLLCITAQSSQRATISAMELIGQGFITIKRAIKQTKKGVRKRKTSNSRHDATKNVLSCLNH